MLLTAFAFYKQSAECRVQSAECECQWVCQDQVSESGRACGLCWDCRQLSDLVIGPSNRRKSPWGCVVTRNHGFEAQWAPAPTSRNVWLSHAWLRPASCRISAFPPGGEASSPISACGARARARRGPPLGTGDPSSHTPWWVGWHAPSGLPPPPPPPDPPSGPTHSVLFYQPSNPFNPFFPHLTSFPDNAFAHLEDKVGDDACNLPTTIYVQQRKPAKH